MRVVVAAALLVGASPAAAHHSFAADFDIAKPVRLRGRVTKIEWMNPHVHIYLDVNEQAWSVELGSPNGLRARGWTPKTLKVGEVVTVEGSRAKDGGNLANASVVVLASGVRLLTGSGQGKTS